MSDFDDIRQNYSAPVNDERRERARIMAQGLQQRLNMHLAGSFDSCTLQGLGDELEEVVRQFRAMGDRSVEEHMDPEKRTYVVYVRSVSRYRCEFEATEADKRKVARDLDGGIFEEIGVGTWEIEEIEPKE